MIAFHNVLCPVGLAPPSESVIATAASLAHHLRSNLDMLHVVTDRSPCRSRPDLGGALPGPVMCESLLNRMRRLVAPTAFRGDATRVSLRAGTPVTQILYRASEVEADLIVIGRTSADDSTDAGSITGAVCQASRRPVLVVPSGRMVGGAASAPFREIVCAIDSSLTSHRAIQLAVALADDSQARLLILHVTECAPSSESVDARAVSDDEVAREWMRTALSNTRRHWLEADAVSAYGSRAHHILSAAHTRHADLIIMERDDVKNGSGGATDCVVRKASCPVLLVDRTASRPVTS